MAATVVLTLDTAYPNDISGDILTNVHAYFDDHKYLELSARPDMRLGVQQRNEMNASKPSTEARTEPTEKFYLPAVAVSPNLGRVEALVDDLFDFHGVVPIPTSYNK